ncbi:MAG: CUAEP/CCAEP-tail radical SAM protein [Myxococcales bacterium]
MDGLQKPGAVLVVSCYELGRQPVSAATALAELSRAGFAPAVLDVAVEALDDDVLRRARLVAISVPMHLALRLGVRVAQRVRLVNPGAHVCLFGLYAALNRDHLLGRHCDSVVGGESDEPLRRLAEALGSVAEPATGSPRMPGGTVAGVATALHPALPPPAKAELRPALPQRTGLPTLSRYAQLDKGGLHLVASVEATRGCLHLCRHCPIVPVYRGRFVAVPRETVLADIAQQVAAGASHVSFGDPDFFNGPTHALRIVEEMHARFSGVTFDATIKIEHLLTHRALLPRLAETGCLFITSAVESLNDRVLAALDKGHVAADVPEALRLTRECGLDLRPTLLPYTPWARLEDLAGLFAFAEEHDLVEQIEPVQYTLRLLIPPGSALLDAPGDKPWLGALDPESFTWRWTHPDPRVDALGAASAALARQHAQDQRPARDTFDALRALAERAAGGASSPAKRAPRRGRAVPRLTEPWFC